MSLLDLVDDLTLVKHSKVRQECPPGDCMIVVGTVHNHPASHTSTVTTAPLLTQLQDAIRSSIGGTAAGASLAHERSVLDSDALHKAMQIAAAIESWCVLVGAHHTRGDMTGNLRSWYTARLATHPTEAEDDWYTAQLRSWIGFVWSKLDPIRERELPDECPACGAREWWRAGEKYYHPLVIRYRGNDADMIRHARALCRACEQVWGVRELAYELELKGADDANTK